MTKFPKSGAFSKWEGLGEFAMFCFHALRGDFNDHDARAAFTKRIIEELWNNCDQNEVSGFVVCCNDYNQRGACAKTELECCKLPFDVLCFPGDCEDNWFHNKGDGGWINWAYVGNVERDGADLYFQPTQYYKNKWAEEKRKKEEEQKKEDEEYEHRDDWYKSGTGHKLPW